MAGKQMGRRQWAVVSAAACAAVLVVVFPPRYVAYSYYPIWYGGMLNLPRLVIELLGVGAVAWAVFTRVSGGVRPVRLTRKQWIVGFVALAALVALDLLVMRLMSLDVVR